MRPQDRSPAARGRAVVLTTVALGAALIGVAAPAHAAPSDQSVRIEGRTATLYEGTLRTDGHAVATPSDGSRPRRCDGTNNGAGTTATATPTSSADDAMRSVGMGWDGYWYPSLEDFFVQQYGPDRENADTYAYWGVLVNGIYTSVGGCQYRLNPNDQTLWVYDAFSRRDLLRLDGPSGIGEATADAERGSVVAPVQRTFTVALGQPLTVTVIRNQSVGDVGLVGYRKPAPGIKVAPVATEANGVQTILEGDPAAVATDDAGQAVLSWSTPGWKRLKATAPGYVRSNRIDVCVLAADGRDCDTAPPDTGTRVAPPSTVPTPKAAPPGGNSLLVKGVKAAPTAFSVGGLQIRGMRITSDGHPSALVIARWQVAGGATKAWRVEYRVPTDRKPRWRTAKSGTTEQSALLDLPAGAAVDLRVRITPPAGRPRTKTIGTVVVPTDERVRQVAISGPRRRENDPRAWRRTVTALRRGATVRTTLPAGRPALVVRSDAKRAVIRVRSGATGRWQRLALKGHADGRTQIVRAARRSGASRIEVRVASGRVRLDGVAVTP